MKMTQCIISLLLLCRFLSSLSYAAEIPTDTLYCGRMNSSDGYIPLSEGAKAPSFRLPVGVCAEIPKEFVRLEDLLKVEPVVVVFLSAAFTGSDFKQLLAYQRELASFKAAGCGVVGISADHWGSLGAFTRDIGKLSLEKSELGFPLLSDFVDRETLARYGVLSQKYMIATRTSFLIDRGGIIRARQCGSGAINPSPMLDACRVLRGQR